MHSVNNSDVLCKGPCSYSVYNPNFGVIGDNYENSRIMFVLHRSDSRAVKSLPDAPIQFNYEEQHLDMLYWNALIKSDTGRAINWLLKGYCNMTMEDVYITNVFKCLLSENMSSKDILPKDLEYRSCVDVLKNQVIAAAPRKIIAFGYKTLEYMLPDVAIDKDLDSLVLTEQLYENIPLMVSYHPGRIHRMPRAESQKYLMTLRNFIKS